MVASKQSQARMSSPERYMVPVVRSTFRILEELSRVGALDLSALARRTGVPKSTVFRILSSLTQLGYVIRDGERNYLISHALAGLASHAAAADALRRAALPAMLRLRDQCGETINLGVLRLDKVVYVEVVPSEYALRLHERPGAAIPAHASALGKAILAFSPPGLAESLTRGRSLPVITRNTITDPGKLAAELRRVSDRGFAFDRGETAALATCVGAPILDEQGTAVAAISISGPTSRFNPGPNSPIIKSLLTATGEVSSHLRTPRPDAALTERGSKAPRSQAR